MKIARGTDSRRLLTREQIEATYLAYEEAKGKTGRLPRGWIKAKAAELGVGEHIITAITQGKYA